MAASSCLKGSARADRDTVRTRDGASVAATNQERSQSENGQGECINLNTAGAEALMSLPGIGVGLAQKIIEHRTKYGPFQRPQDVIIINGFSERRYRRIEPYVCAY